MLKSVLKVVATILWVGAAFIAIPGAAAAYQNPPEMPNIDADACTEYMDDIFDYDDASEFSSCVMSSQIIYFSECIIFGPPFPWCPQIIWDVVLDDCLARTGLTRPPAFVAAWEYRDPHCASVTSWTTIDFYQAIESKCFGYSSKFDFEAMFYCAIPAYFQLGVGYSCPYHTCTGEWPDFSGDDDDTADDDTTDDDALDDDAADDDAAEDRSFAPRLELPSRPEELLPSTVYEFELVVTNDSPPLSFHWIHRIKVLMPSADWDVDPSSLRAPGSVHGFGNWNGSAVDGIPPSVRFEFDSDFANAPLGDIREGEALAFAFRARSDSDATDGFHWTIEADSGEAVTGRFRAVPIHGIPSVAEASLNATGDDDDTAADDDAIDDDAFDDDAFDVDSDADDDDDDDANVDDNDEAQADDDDDDGGGLFSC
ncbi:hypothetical protein K8I61_04190 [bacterium]|nr:hypothetical protein [bacterium]